MAAGGFDKRRHVDASAHISGLHFCRNDGNSLKRSLIQLQFIVKMRLFLNGFVTSFLDRYIVKYHRSISCLGFEDISYSIHNFGRVEADFLRYSYVFIII